MVFVHQDPARDWTVAELAAQVAMSCSAFAARFSELVGEPPMQYVTRWRMHVALAALREGPATAAEPATRLGYQSDAAFNRGLQACHRDPARRSQTEPCERPAGTQRRVG
jgi:AraC-like DNA-binding protein